MLVSDPIDELHAVEPRADVRQGAMLALDALYQYHRPDRLNNWDGDGGVGPNPASLQVPGEAIALVRASLVAALAALDRSRIRKPSGPMGLVPQGGSDGDSELLDEETER